MPNFLIIGAQKSGTTSLHRYLSQHPDIYMSPIKETNFFCFVDNKYEFSASRSKFFNQKSVKTIEKYQALFDGVRNETAIGEVSPSYMPVYGVADRIQKYLPKTKLIAILRHPAEAAYSEFMMRVRDGIEPLTDFREAIKDLPRRSHENLPCSWYIERGFYYTQLKAYFDKFNREQIRVYFFEDLRNDQSGTMKDIFRFLEVDENFELDFSKKYNVSGTIKNPLLNLLWTRSIAVRDLIRPLIPENLRQAMVQLVIRNLVKTPLDTELRAELVELYREDILKLQTLLQCDLSHWLA